MYAWPHFSQCQVEELRARAEAGEAARARMHALEREAAMEGQEVGGCEGCVCVYAWVFG
jgi:hypothetical protein